MEFRSKCFWGEPESLGREKTLSDQADTIIQKHLQTITVNQPISIGISRTQYTVGRRFLFYAKYAGGMSWSRASSAQALQVSSRPIPCFRMALQTCRFSPATSRLGVCGLRNVYTQVSRSTTLPMPPPSNSTDTGGRLSGNDMQTYMEAFADKFLKGKIRYGTEVLNIQRDDAAAVWVVEVEDKKTCSRQILKFSRIVLCTGGCSNPFIPPKLSPSAAKDAQFRGIVIHSTQYRSQMDEILRSVKPIQESNTAEEVPGSIVVIGGGKSAQDIAAHLANQGRKVSVVFETADAILAVSRPLPEAIRKSRLLGILSPHIELRTRLERFLHNTWLGSKIVHFVWNAITQSSFTALAIPKDSPQRQAHSLFWGIRANDEGVGRPNGFHALVNDGKINLVAPARVDRFGTDGHSVVLDNGETLTADAVVLATGYSSSWSTLFTKKTADDLGISRHPPTDQTSNEWNYASLANPPPAHPDSQQWASSIYRGLVPAKNINRRDFAINGAIFTTNNGYAYEVSAHWISSYFLGDKMHLPSSPEDAFAHAERNAAWMRKRYPDMLLWTNESYSSGLAFWTWPQAMDELLEDMELPSMRSGGNWLTWPFKVIDLKEISTLGEERRANRGGR